jgi:hypothetical protein
MRTLFLAAAMALASVASAQVVNVNNTGCPGAGYPTHNNTARINQTFTFSWPCAAGEVPFAIFGFASGNNIPFFPPVTCVPGPCNWYVAPIVAFPTSTTGFWSLSIPNNRQLLFSTWSIQCGCVDTTQGCATISGALTLAVGP